MSLIWLHGSERVADLFNNLLFAGLAAAAGFVITYLIMKLLGSIRKK